MLYIDLKVKDDAKIVFIGNRSFVVMPRLRVIVAPRPTVYHHAGGNMVDNIFTCLYHPTPDTNSLACDAFESVLRITTTFIWNNNAYVTLDEISNLKWKLFQT